MLYPTVSHRPASYAMIFLATCMQAPLRQFLTMRRRVHSVQIFYGTIPSSTIVRAMGRTSSTPSLIQSIACERTRDTVIHGSTTSSSGRSTCKTTWGRQVRPARTFLALSCRAIPQDNARWLSAVEHRGSRFCQQDTSQDEEAENRYQNGISLLGKAEYQFYSDSLRSVSRSSRYVMYRSRWAIRSRNALFSASACSSRASNRAAKYRL
jgi:hypothetical protein